MMKNYDAIFIGSGQAGTPLVFKYAAAQKKVAFIEKQHYAGTCLNVGCTPTKTYVASAKKMHDIQRAGEYGIALDGDAKVDLAKVKERKDQLVGGSVKGLTSALENEKNIDLYNGQASFTDNKTVQINGENITAEKIFINVGGRARVPKEFEKVDYLTNEGILELTELPDHLLIVGGSYIGLEFGQMFRRFGSKVTIIERGERLISREDEDVSQNIQQILEDEGVNFRMNANCLGAKQEGQKQIKVQLDCDENEPNEVTGSHLLLAVGRVSNADTLHLEATDIKTDKRDHIQVNDYLETDVKGVYALGDCNGKGAFTHTSVHDFQIVYGNLFENKDKRTSDRVLAYGLYIDPPLGRAGMTLTQAKEAYKNVKVAEYSMSKVARAKEKGETKGFMRIVIDGDTDLILGASILGIGGDEIISGILNLMYAKKPYTLIRDSVQIHPTVSELIPTMLENTKEA